MALECSSDFRANQIEMHATYCGHMRDQSGMMVQSKRILQSRFDRETLCVEVEAVSESEAVSENLR